MKYREFVKDYSEYVNQLKNLTNNECEKSDKKQKNLSIIYKNAARKIPYFSLVYELSH